MNLQETQDFLKENLSGFVACSITDNETGMPLLGVSIDPNFDLSVPSGLFAEVMKSASRAFEFAGWGMPNEILIPGETHTVIIIPLAGGKYHQGLAVTSQTSLGMVRAIFNKVKSEIEPLLP